MQIFILYNDFDYVIERASCDGQKMEEMAEAYNGPGDLGPYCVITIELEDIPHNKPLHSDMLEKCRFYTKCRYRDLPDCTVTKCRHYEPACR